jgi:NADPH:quinone reductase-like Zn-dependent oxidoreductase
MWATLTGAGRVVNMPGRWEIVDLMLLRGLMEAGILRTVIEKRYPLAQIAEAHRLAESGRKKGHVLVVCE